jgi:hypothetical protein
MRIEWQKDNDQEVFIENVEPGRIFEVFVASTSLQTEPPVNEALKVTAVYGEWDIKQKGAPTRLGVSCYRAVFLGAAITEFGIPEGALIVREGQKTRVFATLKIREDRPAEAPTV